MTLDARNENVKHGNDRDIFTYPSNRDDPILQMKCHETELESLPPYVKGKQSATLSISMHGSHPIELYVYGYERPIGFHDATPVSFPILCSRPTFYRYLSDGEWHFGVDDERYAFRVKLVEDVFQETVAFRDGTNQTTIKVTLDDTVSLPPLIFKSD